MNKHTKRGSSGPAAEPVISPEELYDILMQEIEPDLTMANIGTLEQKYADETVEEHRARMAHYEFAFVIFDDCLLEIGMHLEEDVRILKEEMKRMAKEEATSEEVNNMKNIEQSLDNSDSNE